VPFDQDGLDPQDEELPRDLGIALLRVIGRGKIDPSLYADRALQLLEAAARRDPRDVEAWEKKARVLILRQRPSEALGTLETLLQRCPDRETALADAATLAQSLNADERALTYWRRAVAANPWMYDYRGSLAILLARRGAWAEARAQCQDWLRLAPGSASARRLWVRCLLRSGNLREARAEVDRLVALQPEDRERLEAWFAEQQW
jgi:tetratricopeptide (TPR) repeat protein